MNPRRKPPFLLAALALLGVLAILATASAPALAAGGVSHRALYSDGPDNRYLVGGGWLFRLDREGVGLAQGFQNQATTAGWTPTSVPNAWNAGDDSPESMIGTVGWYRKGFRLPGKSSRLSWILRFESVNNHATVWVNGQKVGSHTGAFLPFEITIPSKALKRKGLNRLVVRVDGHRGAADFPPFGLSNTGVPTGGWWNYDGLLREVYLKRVDTVDIANVLVRPTLPCAKCGATILTRVTVRNLAPHATRVSVAGSLAGRSLRLGSKNVPGRRSRVFETRIKLRHPRLWSPAHPHLYRARITVRAGGRTVQGYSLHTGVRSIKVSRGRLVLNGRPVHLRGVGLHEDDPRMGSAIDGARRSQIVAQAKELGATVIRSHYPLHPQIQELADRLGLLIWSEVPVYSIKAAQLRPPSARRHAVGLVEQDIIANRNHPSVMLWSIANELTSTPGPVQSSYFKAATARAKSLDPTRPVALAINGYPNAGCRPQYGVLDVIGINSYFGWYPGPGNQLADRAGLSGYLDQVRRCYPRQAIVVSEFGAEANRAGPVEEKGTYEFQQDYVRYHLGVYASKPWLSGALYWTLQEFRVRPNWDGGNPKPNPPLHQKGLLAFDGSKKPAWYDVQNAFKTTNQLGP
jgi:beta-glucuronidase